jgi:hypothetical protein
MPTSTVTKAIKMLGSINSSSIAKFEQEPASNYSSQIKPTKKAFNLPIINSAREDDYQWQD